MTVGTLYHYKTKQADEMLLPNTGYDRNLKQNLIISCCYII